MVFGWDDIHFLLDQLLHRAQRFNRRLGHYGADAQQYPAGRIFDVVAQQGARKQAIEGNQFLGHYFLPWVDERLSGVSITKHPD